MFERLFVTTIVFLGVFITVDAQCCCQQQQQSSCCCPQQQTSCCCPQPQQCCCQQQQSCCCPSSNSNSGGGSVIVIASSGGSSQQQSCCQPCCCQQQSCCPSSSSSSSGCNSNSGVNIISLGRRKRAAGFRRFNRWGPSSGRFFPNRSRFGQECQCAKTSCANDFSNGYQPNMGLWLGKRSVKFRSVEDAPKNKTAM